MALTDAEKQKAYRDRQRTKRQQTAATLLRLRLRPPTPATAPTPSLPVLMVQARVAVEDLDEPGPRTESDNLATAADAAKGVYAVLRSVGISAPIPTSIVLEDIRTTIAAAFNDPTVMKLIDVLGGTEYCRAVLMWVAEDQKMRTRKERDRWRCPPAPAIPKESV